MSDGQYSPDACRLTAVWGDRGSEIQQSGRQDLHQQMEVCMSSTEERIRKLIADNLEVDGKPVSVPEDLNVSMQDLGVSSIDYMSFGRIIQQEFDVPFGIEQCNELQTIAELVEYLDAHGA